MAATTMKIPKAHGTIRTNDCLAPPKTVGAGIVMPGATSIELKTIADG
jgi:hypothetical protein